MEQQTYSLFLITKSTKTMPRPVEIVQTFWTLEEAKLAQKEYELKTIILTSW